MRSSRWGTVNPKRQGLLQELYVEEGDRVRQGQALTRIRSGDLNERLKELQANLAAWPRPSWPAPAVNGEHRRRQLFASQAISADDYQRALGAFGVDQANVAAARQRLEQRQVERAELIVRAPFDGVITQRFADPGAFVTPTTTASATAGATSSSVVELAQGLEVLAKVPENEHRSAAGGPDGQRAGGCLPRSALCGPGAAHCAAGDQTQQCHLL